MCRSLYLGESVIRTCHCSLDEADHGISFIAAVLQLDMNLVYFGYVVTLLKYIGGSHMTAHA